MHGRRVVLAMAAMTVMAAAAMLLLPWGGSADSSCGSVADRQAEWSSVNSCGITYAAATGASVGLFVVAALLVVLGWRAPEETRLGAVVLLGAFTAGLGTTVALSWSAASYPEPVLGRGWTSARNLAGLAAAYLGFLLTLAVARARQESRLSDGPGSPSVGVPL